MDEIADARLPRLMTGAEAASLQETFEQHLRDLARLSYRVAFAVLRRREDAEDVAQEALVRAYRKLPSLRNHERCRAWLVRISWRLALDHRRSWKRRELREQKAAPAQEADGRADASSREFQERLWDALEELPDKLRVTMVLAGIQGYDVREVAHLLEVPEGTVKSRMHLARKRLAERLR
jgi:RNA polymerase sigma-70 factor (ECF subfamily)